MTKPVSKQKIFLVMAIGIIFMAVVPLIRVFFYESSLPLEMPYYDSLLSQHISENGITRQEPFIQRYYAVQPYHLLLVPFIKLIGNTALMIFPIVFGATSLIIFYHILKKLNFRHEKIFLIMLVLILTPNFIYTFSIAGSQALALMLALLTLYLFMLHKKQYKILTVVLCAIAPLFNFLNAALLLAVLLIFALGEKTKLKQLYSCAIATVAVIVFHAKMFGMPKLTTFLQKSMLRNFVADFGALTGFSLFNLLLALLGLYLVWRTRKYLLAYALLFLFIIASLYTNAVHAHLNIIFALFAGTALLSLANMPWRIHAVKYLTIIILISGLALSTFSTMSVLAKSQPHNEIIESLNWLKSHTSKEDKIFSHYTKGFWIESIAHRSVLLDSNLASTPNAAQLYNDSNTIFNSRNLETTTAILDKYSIDYIFIDKDMKSGQVWTEPEQGLQFILANSEMFKKIYAKEGIEIWKYEKK
ncbi:MAG: hypothetical protein QXH80_01125 [Candidatus Nanoarchaeia archaeon]